MSAFQPQQLGSYFQETHAMTLLKNTTAAAHLREEKFEDTPLYTEERYGFAHAFYQAKAEDLRSVHLENTLT